MLHSSLLLLAATSCGAEQSGSDAGLDAEPDWEQVEVAAGVTLRGGDFASREDHLIELLVHEGYVYVANSNRTLASMRLEPDGGVTLIEEGMVDSIPIRCTNLAVHAPSSTIYCGTDDPFDVPAPILERYDISTPGALRRREPFGLAQWSVRDVEVMGDHLVINHFDGGLWVADIDAEGELSQLRDTGVQGNARVSVALGDRVVTLLADIEGQGAQLRLLDPGDWSGEWSELARLDLSGPALGLSADAGGAPAVGVGLGSGGMAIVDRVDDTLVLRRILEPPAVVTSGLLDGEIAVAVTLSGVFAWDLTGAEARMFGFGPSGQLGYERAGNMLHGIFHEGEVLTSDWLFVERWALDPAGENVDLDIPRGVYVAPEGSAAEGPIRWRVRNPGEAPLRAEFWVEGKPELAGTIPAGEVVEFEFPPEQRARLLPPDVPAVNMVVRAYHPEVPSVGAPLSSARLVLAQREPNSPFPPATGEQFPPLLLAELDLEQTFDFPSAGGSQTIWLWPDCGLMWPQLEDLAWEVREGRDLGRGEPIFLSDFDLRTDGFIERWGLEGARFGIWGPYAPTEVYEANAVYGEDIYMRFFIQEMPGDAMPTDYVVTETGTISSIERMYRGPWTLAVPWPWD